MCKAWTWAGRVWVCILLGACADEVTEQSARVGADAQLALQENDASRALFLAKLAMRDRGPTPALMLTAATACLELKRYTDAIEYAEQGLTLTEDPGATADLQWALGKARMGRFRELADGADWRRANSALEKATTAGGHRLEAALLIVVLQDLGPEGTAERQLKFARLARTLDPDSSDVRDMLELLRAKGLQP